MELPALSVGSVQVEVYITVTVGKEMEQNNTR